MNSNSSFFEFRLHICECTLLPREISLDTSYNQRPPCAVPGVLGLVLLIGSRVVGPSIALVDVHIRDRVDGVIACGYLFSNAPSAFQRRIGLSHDDSEPASI